MAILISAAVKVLLSALGNEDCSEGAAVGIEPDKVDDAERSQRAAADLVACVVIRIPRSIPLHRGLCEQAQRIVLGRCQHVTDSCQ